MALTVLQIPISGRPAGISKGSKMNKNEIAVVKIIDMNDDGEGIGKLDGYTLFIKDTVIGDLAEVKVIKAKKNYGYARLIRLIEGSLKRVEPVCPVARQCGGCQLQAYDYKAQLEFKENKIRNNLERIGKLKDFVMEPIIGMENPFHYRNKAQFPIGRGKDGRIVAGFYAGRTHSIIENDDCVLGVACNKTVLEIVKKFMEECNIEPYDELNHRGLVRHVLIRQGFYTKQIMVSIVINGKKLPKSGRLVEELIRIPGMTSITLSLNEEKTNVIMGKRLVTLWGKDYIEDSIGGIMFQISPLSFYQVNPVQTEKLYGKALEYAGLTGEEIVWDLYCGIGTISLFLAGKAKKVYGVEIVPEAIENARGNAKRNGFSNTEFFVGKAEEVLPDWYEKHKERADVIVVDPPRKGCDRVLLETMARMQPERIVYVSCDSATLARDLKVLAELGYEIVKAVGVDMFGMSVHCEVCVELYRKK